MNRPLPGQVRIIAGTLRGSKLPVADVVGLRPSPDRVRETLFNWLHSQLSGARVLDLFAGSGALGFEAASRGAADVVLLERDAQLVASLRASALRLKVDHLRVEHADALAWLARTPEPAFDLVFVDPPFAAGLWDQAAQALLPWLAQQAWIYVEMARSCTFTAPPGWVLHRQGQIGAGRQLLFRTGAD